MHSSCTSLLNFGLKNDAVHSLKFVKNLEKNISWNATKTIAQSEISLINLEPGFPKCIAQLAILNLIVIQIEGE